MYNIYFRNDDGTLGNVHVSDYEDDMNHKDAIFEVKEMLVEQGDCLTNKPVLALIQGGKQ